ncbi:TonB-dependent receptor [Myxococcota bacterium]|nr:TonB-dependent receptor [Myxococcota bacterium]MBU1431348.1 TonB-dependent receptor [Myxococcota bacterium]MBU1900284.1 TonB-dependent receptor [Myxococcota bacterium]
MLTKQINIFILLLLFSSPSLSKINIIAGADEADIEFRLGNDAYRSGDFKKALSHYFSSYRIVPNKNVIFNIATCYERISSDVEAYRYYNTYLNSITNEDDKIKVNQALSRVKNKLGFIKVETSPPGALIFLNRKDLGDYGVSPQLIPVVPGKYNVILLKNGFNENRANGLIISSNETQNINVNLDQIQGVLSLSGEPKNVIISSEDFGKLELTLPKDVNIPVGDYDIQFQSNGYKNEKFNVKIQREKPFKLKIKLKKQVGSLIVKGSEFNSSIFLNEKLYGFTPTVIDNIDVGKYRLKVRKSGFQTFEKEIEVKANEKLDLDIELYASSEVNAASKESETLRDAPASVSLISSLEIDAFSYFGTSDALRGLRGVFITDDMMYKIIGVRGYGPLGQYGNRNITLIDGHVINDNWVETSFSDFEFYNNLYGLDRIEFIRGPNSVLYGSGAFQGVTSLISEDITNPSIKSKIGVSAISDKTSRAYAHIRHPFNDGGLQLSLGGTYIQPHDFEIKSAIGSEEYPDGIVNDVGEMKSYNLQLNTIWKNFKLYSYFHHRYTHNQTAAYEVILGDTRAHETEDRAFVDLRYNLKLSNSSSLNLKTYYDYYKYDGAYPYKIADGGFYQEDFNGQWGGFEAQMTLNPFDGARWTFGAEFVQHFLHKASVNSDVDGEITSTSVPFSKLSANAMLRQRLWEGASLWGGARFDLWRFDTLPTADGGEASRSIANVNPRVVLITSPTPRGTLKMILARGFRAPSVYELTYNDGGVTHVANPDIDPETLYSTEVEFTQGLSRELELIGALYLNRINDRIEIQGEGVTEDPQRFDNIPGELWGLGAELELRRPFARGWMLSAQYAFQRTADGDLSGAFDPHNAITNSPIHLAGGKIVIPLVGRALRLAHRLVFESGRLDRERQVTDPALLADVIFSGEAAGLPLRYSFGVRNLLDWRHDHPAGDEIPDVRLRMSGRTFSFELSAEL